MIRLLLAVNLILMAGLLGSHLAERLTEHVDSAHYQRMAQVAEADRESCDRQHATLLRYIKREGLWQRLGLAGQPWLTQGR